MKLQSLTTAVAAAIVLAACSQTGTTGGLPSMPQTSTAGSQAATAAKPAGATQMTNVRSACPAATRGQAQCDALIRTDLFYKSAPAYAGHRLTSMSQVRSDQSSNYYGPLDPAHIQQAYNFPSSTKGSGETVAIVDAYDDPNAEADLATYRAAFGLPPCTTANKCFRKLNQQGYTAPLPSPDPGWASEISLDLDMVSAVCPLCHIVLIEANSNYFSDLGTAELIAKAAGARQVSNSYGGGEGEASDTHYDIPGVTITASSGDSSWYAGPADPCALASVICVGGTSIYPYNNTRGWLEKAWSDAGSGCSQYVPAPSYVPAKYQCGSTHMRPESDVSADADPYTGVLVYDSFETQPGFYVYGGTSVSSPIIASAFALSGRGGFDRTAQPFWTAGQSHSSSLNDVTIGNNGQADVRNDVNQLCNWYLYICYAMPGYDGPTGNGTPNGVGAF